MKEAITAEEIHGLQVVWHELIIAMQKTSEQLWKGKLEGASTIDMSILSVIERKPDVILKEIIEILGVPASTLTSAIDRLEKRGLLRRSISQRDRRSFCLELTEDGQIAQQEHRAGEVVLWQKVLGSFQTSAERQELIRLLKILADNVYIVEKDLTDEH